MSVQWRRSTFNIGGGDIPSLSLPSPSLPFSLPLSLLPFPFPSLSFSSLSLPPLSSPFPSPYSRLGGLGERLSSPSGSGQSEAAKRILMHFGSVCLSVCRLSVTFVHPTQPIEIFGNVSAPRNTLVT